MLAHALQRLAGVKEGQAIQWQRAGLWGGLRAGSESREGAGAAWAGCSGGGSLLLGSAAVGRHVWLAGQGRCWGSGARHGAAGQGGSAGAGAEGGRHVRLGGGGRLGLHVDGVGADSGNGWGLLACGPGAGQGCRDGKGVAAQGGEGAGGGQCHGRLVGVNGGDAAAVAVG